MNKPFPKLYSTEKINKFRNCSLKGFKAKIGLRGVIAIVTALHSGVFGFKFRAFRSLYPQ